MEAAAEKKCRMCIEPSAGILPEGLWYAGAYESYIPEILDIQCLTQLRKNMHRCHTTLDDKPKRVSIFKQYCESECDDNPIKQHMLRAVGNPIGKSRIKKSLNEPTFEAFKVLKLAGLPKRGEVVFSSTATANSGNNDSVTTALEILQHTDGITFHRSSTVNSTGKTGVSCVDPKNYAVQYDEFCDYDNWIFMVRFLGLQFMQITDLYRAKEMKEYVSPNNLQDNAIDLVKTTPMPKSLRLNCVYDRMYHWGCISQSFAVNVMGRHVSEYEVHEEWNVNMMLAMMWHAAMTAKTGGQVCIKLRIFKRAETLGFTALFSNLFDRCTISENSRQTAYFAVGIFDGMTDDEDLRLEVASALWNAMDQRPEKVFQHDLMRTPRSMEMLPLCSDVRNVIKASISKTASVYLLGLSCLEKCVATGRLDPLTCEFKPILDSVYPPCVSSYYLAEWIKALKSIKKSDMKLLVDILRKPWMLNSA
jgi:hypothetical protein